jgi:hypothetical protein
VRTRSKFGSKFLQREVEKKFVFNVKTEHNDLFLVLGKVGVKNQERGMSKFPRS